MSDAWRNTWNDRELAEWISPPPCMCGCDADDHIDGCGCYCPGWIPDRDRLCDRCMAGLALDEDSPECTKCANLGWIG
jgi:hypothetical protein